MGSEQTFRPRVDRWLVLAAAFALPPLLIGMSDEGERMLGLVIYRAVLAIDLFWLGLFLPIQYRLTPLGIEVRAGVMRWAIPFADIVRLGPVPRGLRLSTGPSAATSFQALEVCYRKGRRTTSLIISPAKQDRFVEAVRTRAPHLVAEGGALHAA